MERIKLLDNNTSNKIAAGEVVERPFSVVKELVENSIDAGSKNITINIEEGGSKKIEITDDGRGIHKDDIELSFQTHATSKIANIEDVYHISSMGFRGEALASIGAVSKVRLISRTNEFDFGREIYINGGHIEYIKDQGANIGTKIEVNDLFYNVPARLKFLKSPQREGALISDIISRYAISFPNISFNLINNGKKVIFSYGNGKIEDAISSIYGKEVRNNTFSFESNHEDYSIKGFLGLETLFKGSRKDQSIFINNRYVKNKLISVAAENAFKSFITINKFPFFIIFININPELIDVNVHPTKSEVKFQNEREIFKGVFDSIHESIRKSKINNFNDISEEEIKYFDEIKETGENVGNVKESCLGEKNNAPSFVTIPLELTTKSQNEPYFIVEEKKERKLKELKIIGQYHKTYILCEDNENLFLIDQHAAHEKIIYENYIKELNEQKVASQLLITKIVIELSFEDFLIYEENKQIFKDSGFKIETFGEHTIKISEAPIFLGKIQLEDLFKDILDSIKSMGKTDNIHLRWRKIATIACRSAVKAMDTLSLPEITKLINDLTYLEDPFNCPHGRPTIIKYSLNDIEKSFKRID